jgi:hypothetical protein
MLLACLLVLDRTDENFLHPTECSTSPARSAYKGEHVGKKGDLGRFLAAILSGAVSKGSILIAENADRLSRQGNKIARKLLEQIVDKGVDVHIVNIEKKLTMGWENRPNDYTIVDSELNRAYRESERKSKIIKAGLKVKKHSDDWAGNLPFWLQKVDESGKSMKGSNGYKIVEIPEKAALVREIFRLAANGLGAKRIMQDLASRGIACGIAVGTVGNLLRNRAVLGEHQPLLYLDGGAAIPDGDPVFKFPRVIDQTQFDTVTTRLDGKMKVCADGKTRPATGSHQSNEAYNLFDGLLHDVTEQTERTLQLNNKGGNNNPHLISKFEPGRKSNRIRYDLFEKTFLGYLTEADWKAIAGEKETENLKKARLDLNIVMAELDKVERLLARRTEQALNPDLPDAVVAEYLTQVANPRSAIATLTGQQYRLESLISMESARSAALETPEKLVALITVGDPAMRLALRAELQRVISRIDFDFAIDPDRITITVTFINDARRTTGFRKPIRFTKPLHPSRRRRTTRLQRVTS